jgi:hypothetical protein
MNLQTSTLLHQIPIVNYSKYYWMCFVLLMLVTYTVYSGLISWKYTINLSQQLATNIKQQQVQLELVETKLNIKQYITRRPDRTYFEFKFWYRYVFIIGIGNNHVNDVIPLELNFFFSFIIVIGRQNMFNLISHWITVLIGNHNLKEKN